VEAEGEFQPTPCLTGKGEVVIREDVIYNGEVDKGQRNGTGILLKGMEKYDGHW
jgi:hypothetical protein